ncbi:LysR family transcriptional regulator [Oceanospirillum sediminis]|uniref:LysR family transcriptional regulator n=1 Tax=Oceanospirillum sediminis TaxID=2760088 RepID=A0A839IP28_9GAMM|nr:LysR family transcriptional regulator [Oceanospirillum sediminis]MBB1486249.1 LysR family transcriptional regulator [Oceanospirillum sediminis]
MTIVSRTEDLEILLAVVDCGGFSAAARQLDIQVAKVSRAISRLEHELNATLMNRTTRRLQLTEEGKLFTEQVRSSLQQLAAAEESLKLAREAPSGRLRIDAASPFIIHQLVPLMTEFRQLYPSIQPELIANEAIIDLIEKRTDIAIRIGELEDSNLHARMLGRGRLHIVASPEYLDNYGIPETPQTLTRHQLIGFSDSPHLNLWPFKAALRITPAISSSNGEVVRQLCLQGHGLALLSNFMVTEDIQKGRLISVMQEQLVSPNRREQVQAVYYRNTSVAARITAFLDFIQPRLSL